MTTAGEVLSWPNLTVRQQEALARIKVKSQEVEGARANVDFRLAKLHAEIYNALTTRGVPARVVSEELGLSVSRVYQIKDEVAAWRTER